MGWGRKRPRGAKRGGNNANDAKKEGGENKQDVWKYSGLDLETLKCEKLNEYYGCQEHAILPGEWDQIIETLKRPLPVTFRVNMSDAEDAKKTVAKIREIQKTMKEAGVPEDKMLKEVEWFPGEGMCWQANVSRRELRKEVPGARSLHEFLLLVTQQGKISRQELVSMIPPLFLDVHSDHFVLDCCAAPGSKTSQLMEMLARETRGANSDGTDKPITGVVMANDMNPKRCEVLVTQTSRLREVYPNTIITNHNAAQYPMPCVPVWKDGTSEGPREVAALKKTQFDRILADVVCSGDGTFRKSLDLWGRWTPHCGNSCHKPQVQILMRCMDMLKEGGRLVYSTCSLNPVEDEAVLLHCMKKSKHNFALVDCSDMVTGLQRAGGVHDWIVSNKACDAKYRRWSDVPEEVRKTNDITESMFATDDAKDYHLERSMRFKPHTHDTGGFFVAVLTKVKEEEKAAGRLEVDTTPAEAGVRWLDVVQGENITQKQTEHAMVPLKEKEAALIKKELKLKDDFPMENLFCRGYTGNTRRAYLFCDLARDLLTAANYKKSGDGKPPLKVVGGGLRAAEKNSGNSAFFRCPQEAAAMLHPRCDASLVHSASRRVFAALCTAPSQPWLYFLQHAGDDAVAEDTALFAAMPDGANILVIDDPAVRYVAAVVRKSGNKLHLWADLQEVERLRVALDLPTPPKPTKEDKNDDDDESPAGDDKDDKEESDAKRQRTE
eukprot:TRINITY_DN3985_c0_g1_i1.p1 TRINITY_DN3985_c0_g1~~TRINITY_DN3985_c0_g1_i1.p1  ORF type:complete len:721 (+),score=295.29 TRINITY_DN3985_c0_g1_i1:33-2195(+)